MRGEQSRNAKAGETGDFRENPPTSGIVLLDSHLLKSGSDLAGDQSRFVLVEAWSSPGTKEPRKREIPEKKNPPTNGIVRHDSHVRKSRVARPGIEPGSPWWEASRPTAQPPSRH
ncbi:hypothetical protein PR048_003464 [Dryococelus australis]|uniref:Uncharacterized protein n=1 Tax=Dryococelus australis TaxID=614101 RepID=A0ABQ9IPH0_9NEOP|nr:hypothetical protein PR048_003464 [Dryococelus australis]